MSFWSALGKIAAPIGALAAAPFTGGTSLAWLPAAIGAGGAALSSASGSMANNRGTSAELTLDANRQFEDELLKREMEKRANRNDALKQSVFASLLSQYHPAQRPMGISQSPFQGLGDIGGQATNFAAQDALTRLKAGDQLPALQRPDLSKFMNPSAWERILGIAGAGMGAYGALTSLQGKK